MSMNDYDYTNYAIKLLSLKIIINFLLYIDAELFKATAVNLTFST